MPGTKLFDTKEKMNGLHGTHGMSLGNYTANVERPLIGICTRYYKNSEQGYPVQPVELGKSYLERGFLN